MKSSSSWSQFRFCALEIAGLEVLPELFLSSAFKRFLSLLDLWNQFLTTLTHSAFLRWDKRLDR